MPLPDTISGKHATGSVNSNVLAGCHQWAFEESVDNLDGTTGSDGGYANPFAGVKSGTVRMQVYFNVATGVYTPIQAGTTVTDLWLYDDVVNGTALIQIPSGVVMRSTKTAETRGRIEVTCEIATKGIYTVNDP